MTTFRTIPQDSPEAHCLNDLDHRIWKIIARRFVNGKGHSTWGFLGDLGFYETRTTEHQELQRQINQGWVITITGTYGHEQLLFGKRPQLPSALRGAL